MSIVLPNAVEQPRFTWIYYDNSPEEVLPTRGSERASGWDLRAAVNEVLLPGQTKAISNGIGIILPEPMHTPGFIWEAQVRSRSGLAIKYGVKVLNSPGTVDNDYRGLLLSILHNTSTTPFRINRGDRISQLVIQAIPDTIPWENAVWEKDLDKYMTERGKQGFGSTGIA